MNPVLKVSLRLAVTILLSTTRLDAQPLHTPAAAAREISLPFSEFQLSNGLHVVVHTDHKAPVVGISVWYHVGSKYEPAGRSGFAHLFEHLMFTGTENVPGDYFTKLREMGATDYNGSTQYDCTQYFETVPTTALDRALFLESDRMGYLSGSITQARLDEQRGVVENEKRQRDGQPYGMVSATVARALFPAGHPYAHTPIGSIADLDQAQLSDVRNWFHDHYGPNNAVLVLAGDVDPQTARQLAQKYFGAIPAGPADIEPDAAVPTLPAPVRATIHDNVAAVMLTRQWAVPGRRDPASPALDIAAEVLGGGSSSPLDAALVQEEHLATSVTASYDDFGQAGTFSITMMVRPGVDVAQASSRLDALVTDFVHKGPTADAIERAVTGHLVVQMSDLESVGGFGGQANTLALGAIQAGDPGFASKRLMALATRTPATIRSTIGRWLSRPAYALAVVPGNREVYTEAASDHSPSVARSEPLPVHHDRGPLPPVGAIVAPRFPTVERARLRNGIELVYAHRATVPLTQTIVSFDAGAAADVSARTGTEQLTLSMMLDRSSALEPSAFAQARERLGVQMATGITPDRTNVWMNTPSANLAAALDMFSDVLRHPAFDPAGLERLRAGQLATIQQDFQTPGGLAQRVLAPLVASSSPYAHGNGSGDAEVVAKLGIADLSAFREAWLRPDKAKVFVVSDRPLAEIKSLLDARFGDWTIASPAGEKVFRGAYAGASAAPRIILIDRPGSAQSLIVGGVATALATRTMQETIAAQVGNDALGGDFLARLNMDLREARHWSYGVSGSFQRAQHAAPYVIDAPVETDRTGEALLSLQSDLAGFFGASPMTDAEYSRVIAGRVRSLPGSVESSAAVMRTMQDNDLFHRPDDYIPTLADRYRSLTKAEVNAALRSVLDPAGMVWIVVGDAAKVMPQLSKVSLPVERWESPRS